MFSHRLFDKSRMTIAAKKQKLQFHLAAVLTLAGVSFLPSAMTPMNLVTFTPSLSSSSNLSGQQAVLDSVHRSTTVSSGWQKAIEVPGIGALNKGRSAQVNSLSCPTKGNCSAGGYYKDSSGTQAFVVNEVHGIWQKAIEVPGLGALNKGRSAQADSLSCASTGNCSAGGSYKDSSGTQAFVVNEVHGIWQKAIEVPGMGVLNQNGGAQIGSLSCASAGNCSAGGFYENSSGTKAFVVNEVHGIWQKAIEVPGMGALNKGRSAQVDSLSCSSTGNCSAGGFYENSSGYYAFIVNEVHGIWQKAIEVPGIGALNQNGGAQISSLSCSSIGNCSAGGFYTGFAGTQAFVVNEVHGIWQKAIEVPGIGALNQNGGAQINSLSCSSAGNCSAGGFYRNSSGIQAFVVNEVHGIWQKAIEVPGIGALNKDWNAKINSLSCSSAGNCSGGGFYTDFTATQAFVVNEVHGIWQKAIELPGMGVLNQNGGAQINSLSCASAGNCSAGGLYTDFAGVQAFVINEVNNTRVSRG